MRPDLNSDDIDIQNVLRAYAAPAADNGFTAATLARTKTAERLRLRILITAGFIGGVFALSQMPRVWDLAIQIDTPTLSPFILSALGVLGFVAWAALDRGWSDTI